MNNKSQIVKRVAEIYNRLDSEISANYEVWQTCDACGRCCDFDSFDHRLFVTTPELMHLTEKLAPENVRPMTTGRCPYNADGKCTIYEYRFAGCRIFCCKSDSESQNRLSESAVKKFKSICTELDIPYRYTDLATTLNSTAI